MIKDFQFKEKYDFYDLVEIMRILRAPEGCPWDSVQTHESIKKNFIEETYEVVEAINKKDSTLLCEELGDVMMQVVFHAEIEEENNAFDVGDVTDGVCKKLIERHPHIFSDTQVGGVDDVLTNWDAIKKATKKQKSQTESMLSVPRELPALMRSEKIQEKAAKSGFDWDSIEPVFEKTQEELEELKLAVSEGSRENTEEELGDLLFSVVNLSRFLSCDAEDCLTKATDKFIRRFSSVEEIAKERNINMKNASLQELDKLWDEVKSKGE